MDEDKFSNMSEKEIKELEEKLKKCAAKVDPGDFEAHYQAIRDSLPPKQKPRLRPSFWRFFVPIASSFVMAVIVLSITLPFALAPEKQEKYFVEQLTIHQTEETVFLNKFNEAGLRFNKPVSYKGQLYKIFLTESNKVMGGYVEYFGDNDDGYYITLNIYDRRVEIFPSPLYTYDHTYEKNGASVKYGLKEKVDQSDPEPIYEYVAFGTYQKETYLIEYTALTDNITEVFDELFI